MNLKKEMSNKRSPKPIKIHDSIYKTFKIGENKFRDVDTGSKITNTKE